jgi:hypothetical protein
LEKRKKGEKFNFDFNSSFSANNISSSSEDDLFFLSPDSSSSSISNNFFNPLTVNPLESEWESHVQTLHDLNAEILKIPEFRQIGWININMMSLKQNLFTLLTKWSSPFSDFMINGITHMLDYSSSIIGNIRKNFNCNLESFTTNQKIEIINTARKALGDVQLVDTFISEIYRRITLLSSRLNIVAQNISVKLVDFEKQWKYFKFHELKIYLDEIQMMERVVMSEIIIEENNLTQDIEDFLFSLENPKVVTFIKTEKAISDSNFNILVESHKKILKKSDLICDQRKKFGQNASEFQNIGKCSTIFENIQIINVNLISLKKSLYIIINLFICFNFFFL